MDKKQSVGDMKNYLRSQTWQHILHHFRLPELSISRRFVPLTL